MAEFKLQLREDRPATIEEHRALRDELARLRLALDEVRHAADPSLYADPENALSVIRSILG